jgi:riboflavin kinase/FMN adenylyltransferase
MKVIYGKSALENLAIKPSTLTVGTFDGVHKGHVILLDRLVKAAREKDTISVVVTFDPHPQMVLGKRGPTEVLNTTEEKLELLGKFKIDMTVILEFNQQLASLEAESFIERILAKSLGMKHFVIGYDHSFGKDRQGNYELVKSLSGRFNYTYEMVGPVHDGGSPIKSSRIRKELKTGDYDLAIEMIGYHYFLTGEIVKGTGVGRKLGYPTINLNIPAGKLLPREGVYAAVTTIDNKEIPGMAYIGGRLTFGDETIIVEVNLFDFDGDASGKKVKITLQQYTRAPRKFESPDQLQAALAEDEQKVKSILQI